MTYPIAEVFYSLQGEGGRAGSANVFVRFAGCNLSCSADQEGFDCDTDHAVRSRLEAGELVDLVASLAPEGCRWALFTGGEPLLHLDYDLIERFQELGYRFAVETNGTVPMDKWVEQAVDYVACSPKRGHKVQLARADEVRYVLAAGDLPPDHLPLKARQRYLSPAAVGDVIPQENIDWCVEQCLADPRWALSVQQHKLWRIP